MSQTLVKVFSGNAKGASGVGRIVYEKEFVGELR